jgi:hypothetical protein
MLAESPGISDSARKAKSMPLANSHDKHRVQAMTPSPRLLTTSAQGAVIAREVHRKAKGPLRSCRASIPLTLPHRMRIRH